MPSEVEVVTNEPVSHVIVRGEHDLATAEQLDDALTEALSERDQAVLDLSQATFIDSSIVALMIGWSREAQLSEDEALAFVVGESASPVSRVLQLVDLLHQLPCFTTRDAALAALAEGAKPRLERDLTKMTDPQLEQERVETLRASEEGATEQVRAGARRRLRGVLREQRRRHP